MRSTLRTTAAVSLAATLAGGAVIGLAGPATAATDKVAPEIVSASLLNDEIVVPAKGFSDKANFTIRVSDNVGVKGVLVGVFHRGEIVKLPTGEDVIFGLTRTSGTARDGVWKSWIRQEAADAVGSYTLRVLAFDTAGNMSELVKVGTYQARYNTKLSLDVADRTVAKGEALKLSGSLRRVSPTGWQGFAAQKLVVQFREAGTTEWTRVGRVYTGALGTFASDKFTAAKAGSWRVVFAGDAKTVTATSQARKVTIG
jgi:hypothetical protein